MMSDVDDLAAAFLAELRHDPVRAIEGIELTLSQQRGGASAAFAKLAMDMSEDHRMAEPDDPSAGAFCDHCGSTIGLQETDELGTGNRPCACHGMLLRPCKDTGACIRRREERYPPDMARVPSWVLTAGSEAAAAAEVASLVRAAAGQAAAEYVALVRAAAGDEEIRLAGWPVPLLPGWKTTPAGAWDTRGDFIPVNFNWAHTIRGHPANRAHLISGYQLTPARLAASVAVREARGAAVSAQQPPGGQGGQTAPEGLPPGVRQALHGDAPGSDLPMGQAEAMARLRVPEPAPSGPRRGAPRRRLRYSAGRRQVVRRHAQAQPPDSGWGPSGEGPSGGSSET
jgi:hypothetical protein